MDGLDIAYCTIEESGGTWSYEILEAACMPFDSFWINRLAQITSLSAKELLLTHTQFGKWMGEQINQFIDQHQLQHKVHFVASHGHTVFHEPQQGMTFQMGDGAALAAVTKLPVITDLRNMDVALGGQGAPIVPIGEKYLWSKYGYCLNIGGICNISIKEQEQYAALDVCAANRVLNALAQEAGKSFDDEGLLASTGKIQDDLLFDLNDQAYFKKPYPKSLSNEFGTDVMLSILQRYTCSTEDKLRTFCEHIAYQIAAVCNPSEPQQMMVTGGGAKNTFLIQCIREKLVSKQLDVVLPEEHLIHFKEALVMAFIGVLRWREEVNVLSSVTGAERNSIGGALWMGDQ